MPTLPRRHNSLRAQINQLLALVTVTLKREKGGYKGGLLTMAAAESIRVIEKNNVP
jgi:hypothetical protein